MARKRFVKAGRTESSVASSRGELEKMLRRYGCGALAVSQDYAAGIIVVRFTVPDAPGEAAGIPVELRVEIGSVYHAMFGRRYPPVSERRRDAEQAERVAWRHLVLWVDAALSAAEAGVQRISEAFFAHTLVRGDRGEVMRMVDHFSALAPGGNWKALLPPADNGL